MLPYFDDKPDDVDWFGLSKSMDTINCLTLHRRVPVQWVISTSEGGKGESKEW